METLEQCNFKQIYESILSGIEDHEARLRLYEAIVKYQLYGDEPQLESVTEKVIFRSFFNLHLKKSRARALAGRKGGSKSHGGGAPIGNQNATKE